MQNEVFSAARWRGKQKLCNWGTLGSGCEICVPRVPWALHSFSQSRPKGTCWDSMGMSGSKAWRQKTSGDRAGLQQSYRGYLSGCFWQAIWPPGSFPLYSLPPNSSRNPTFPFEIIVVYCWLLFLLSLWRTCAMTGWRNVWRSCPLKSHTLRTSGCWSLFFGLSCTGSRRIKISI